MLSLTYLILRRNVKRYFFVFLLSFTFLALTGSFSIVSGLFEKELLSSTLNSTPYDLELQSRLIEEYSLNNLSSLFSLADIWQANIEWQSHLINDNLVIIPQSFSSNINIGITLYSNSSSLILSKYTNNTTIDIFNSTIIISSDTFSFVNSLPFNLDLLLSKELFLSVSNITNIRFSNNMLGYYANFEPDSFKSPNDFSDCIDSIEQYFLGFFLFAHEINLIEGDLSINQVNVGQYMYNSFFALIILLSISSLLVVKWLIDLFSHLYVNNILFLYQQLTIRGLSTQYHSVIFFFIPALIDTFSYFLYASLIYLITTMLHFRAIAAYIVPLFTYFYILLCRFISFRKIKTNENETNSSDNIILYIISLIFIVASGVLLQTVFRDILPLWFNAVFNVGYIVILYFILTLILSNVIISLLKKLMSILPSLTALYSKSLLKMKKHLRSWIHSVVLLSWVLTIVCASFQSYNDTYVLEYNVDNPPDLTIQNLSITLSELYELNFSSSIIRYIFPISTQQCTFTFPYRLVLMNFTLLERFYSSYLHFAGLRSLNDSFVYIEHHFASLVGIDDSFEFNVLFGTNGTYNFYLSKRVVLVDYFPLTQTSLRPYSDSPFFSTSKRKPFVVASFNSSFVNYTRINHLIVRFNSNISLDYGLAYLEQIFRTPLSYSMPSSSISYTPLLLGYVTTLFIFVLLSILSSAYLLLSSGKNLFWSKFYHRGTSKTSILFHISLLFSLISLLCLIGSQISGFLYIFIHLKTTIFVEDLSLPPLLHFSLGVWLLIPLFFAIVLFPFTFFSNNNLEQR
ncbi:MAG: hypothetical protein ACTSUF_04590 [Candidatus Heimdallarchaeaceae archaeon]